MASSFPSDYELAFSAPVRSSQFVYRLMSPPLVGGAPKGRGHRVESPFGAPQALRALTEDHCVISKSAYAL